MSQKDAQWLRRETVLQVFLACRLEMKASGNPKGKFVLELWGKMLFLGLGFLRVIGHYLSEINIKFKVNINPFFFNFGGPHATVLCLSYRMQFRIFYVSDSVVLVVGAF
jgi:hypothetical protein